MMIHSKRTGKEDCIFQENSDYSSFVFLLLFCFFYNIQNNETTFNAVRQQNVTCNRTDFVKKPHWSSSPVFFLFILYNPTFISLQGLVCIDTEWLKKKKKKRKKKKIYIRVGILLSDCRAPFTLSWSSFSAFYYRHCLSFPKASATSQPRDKMADKINTDRKRISAGGRRQQGKLSGLARTFHLVLKEAGVFDAAAPVADGIRALGCESERTVFVFFSLLARYGGPCQYHDPPFFFLCAYLCWAGVFPQTTG